MRRILFLIVIVLILFGVVYTLFNLEKQQDAHRSAYEAIPRNAALILDIKDAGNAFKEIQVNNQIWEEFSSSELLKDIHELWAFSDTNEALKELLTNNRFIAFALNADTGLSWSFILPLPLDFDEESSIQMINSIENLNWEPESMSGSLELTDLKFSLQFREGLLLLSSSPTDLALMESSLEGNTGLQNDEAFNYAYQVGGKNKMLNIYLHHDEIAKWLITRLSTSLSGGMNLFSQMGKWTELDLLLKSNSIQLNGFSVGDVRLPKGGEVSLESSYAQMLSKTAYYYSSDFNQKQLNIKEGLVDSISTNGFPEVQDLLKQCSSCRGFIFGSKPGLDSTIHEYFILSKSECPKLEELLRGLESFDTAATYPKLLRNLFSIPLEGENLVHKNLNDAHLFTNSVEALNDYQRRVKNLNESNSFKRFKENLLGSSSHSIYLSPYRMKDRISQLFTAKSKAFWERNSSYLERFEGLSWQFSRESDSRIFHHIYLKYNPDFQEDQNYLWLAKGDAKFRKSIYLFKNHYSDADELLVQDVNNRLHLYNNKGKKLWETRLNGPINSKVYIVDRYKNNKYQILLSTSKSIYLIDRKGRNTEGYPIKIEGGLSCGIALMDYEKNSNYRILAPGNSGQLFNYDIDGKKVKGWAYKKDGRILVSPQYLRLGSRDHIIVLTDKGKIFSINRRGELRSMISKDFEMGDKVQLAVRPGSSDQKTQIVIRTDSLIVQFNLKGKQTSLLNGARSDFMLKFFDIDNDSYDEMLIQDKHKLSALEFSGGRLFEFTDTNLVSNTLSPLGKGIFGLANSEAYLEFYRSAQALRSELRVPPGQVLLRDINLDKEDELLYINKEGDLCCLRFEFSD